MNSDNQSQDAVGAYIDEALAAERYAQGIRDANNASAYLQRAQAAEASVQQLTTSLNAATRNAQAANTTLAEIRSSEEAKAAAAEKAEEDDWAVFKTIAGSILLAAAAFIAWRILK